MLDESLHNVDGVSFSLTMKMVINNLYLKKVIIITWCLKTPGQVCSSLGVSLWKRLLAVMFLVVVSGQFCDARPDDQQQTVKLSQTHPKIRLEPTIIQAKLPYSF